MPSTSEHTDPGTAGLSLYAGAGAELVHLRLDEAGALRVEGTTTLRGKVEYAVLSPLSSHLLLATSDGHGSGHLLWAVPIDPATGAPGRPAPPLPLPARPIHVTTDGGTRVFVAHNDPAGLSVAALAPDGHLTAVAPAARADEVGVFPHQVRVTPGGGLVLVVARGHSGAGGRPAAPGAVRVLARDAAGTLMLRQVVAPTRGLPSFHPRHLDFHPRRPWLFVTLEPENLVGTFGYDADGLDPEPLAVVSPLAAPDEQRPRQLAGAVHVHPRGHVVYVANRADATESVGGVEVFAGGENSIAVLAVAADGGLTLLQTAAVDGLHPRCFAVDPGGRFLVAASSRAGVLPGPDGGRAIDPGFTVFAISPDGRLRRQRSLASPVRGEPLWWVGGAHVHPRPGRPAGPSDPKERRWP